MVEKILAGKSAEIRKSAQSGAETTWRAVLVYVSDRAGSQFSWRGGETNYLQFWKGVLRSRLKSWRNSRMPGKNSALV